MAFLYKILKIWYYVIKIDINMKTQVKPSTADNLLKTINKIIWSLFIVAVQPWIYKNPQQYLHYYFIKE